MKEKEIAIGLIKKFYKLQWREGMEEWQVAKAGANISCNKILGVLKRYEYVRGGALLNETMHEEILFWKRVKGIIPLQHFKS